LGFPKKSGNNGYFTILVPVVEDRLALKNMGDYRKLLAYTKSFELAMEMFIVTKHFPPEERYSK
jgi:hypothetical protein